MEKEKSNTQSSNSPATQTGRVSEGAKEGSYEVKTSNVKPVSSARPVTEQSDSEANGKMPLRVSLKKAVTKEDVAKKTAVQEEIVLDNPFSQEELQKAWAAYSETQTDSYFKSTVMYTIPELKSDFAIEIGVINREQENKYKEKGGELKQFLSKLLNNNQISLHIVMKESKESDAIFTNREKYEYLRKKNPDLDLLVKEFNLRLD